MKYIKKPIAIEAVQLTDTSVRDVYTFVYGPPSTNSLTASDRWGDYVSMVRKDGLRLVTLESDGQTQIADIGDWIIKGVRGEFYPCKPDIFKETYDRADITKLGDDVTCPHCDGQFNLDK